MRVKSACYGLMEIMAQNCAAWPELDFNLAGLWIWFFIKLKSYILILNT